MAPVRALRNLLAGSLLLASGGCSRTSCVAVGTLIATPQGLRPIESLSVGQMVYSVCEKPAN